MLSKSEKSFTVIFAIILLLELIFSSSDYLSSLQYITKPLILTSLLIFFLNEKTKKGRLTFYLTVFALFFSLLGDVLLLFANINQNFFIGGLIAFLIAHLFYILIFYQKKRYSKNGFIFGLLLLAFGIAFFNLLKDSLGNLSWPVAIYIIVILSMAFFALSRKKTVSKISYNLVVIGAVFFLVSDSILAINKFYMPLQYANILIMLTYGLAQYLLVFGIKKQL